MAQESCRKSAETLKPAKAYIESCWRSHKRDTVFCLVEGILDKHIYEARLNSNDIEVVIAANEKMSHNKNTVVSIFNELRTSSPNSRVFGIRDKDYMNILGHCCPPEVFITDKRDLEMMIFSSQSFSTADPNIPKYLSVVMPFCTHLAHIRIFAESRKISINNSMKINIVYDQNRKAFLDNAEKILRNKYFTEVDTVCSDSDLDRFILDNSLTVMSFYDICRGHDVVGLIEWVFGVRYSKNSIEKMMERYYSIDDFYETELFSDIRNYCNQYGIEARIS